MWKPDKAHLPCTALEHIGIGVQIINAMVTHLHVHGPRVSEVDIVTNVPQALPKPSVQCKWALRRH